MSDIVKPICDTNYNKTTTAETQTFSDFPSSFVGNMLSEDSFNVIESIPTDNKNDNVESVTKSFYEPQNYIEHNENLPYDYNSDTYEEVDDSSEDESEIDDFFTETSDDERPFKVSEESFHEDERVMFPASKLTVSNVLLMLKAITIKFGSTREQKIALINYTKCLAGPEFSTWNYSPYKLDKYVALPADNIKKHYFCEDCNESLVEMLILEKKKISTHCNSCKKLYTITSANENYFIYFDIQYQLRTLLNKKDIQQSMFDFTKESCRSRDGIMTDITDSLLYKKNCNASNTICFNFSLDGAQQWKSAKKALWPMQIHLNCFVGVTRFKYAILVALYQTEKEPTPQFMNLFMSVLKEQCDVLAEQGIQLIDYWTKDVFVLKLIPFCGCVDTVARPLLQNRIQFNGYFGCSWCYHHGVYYEHAMKFPMQQDDPELRTHESHVKDVYNVISSRRPTEFGVKGDSILLDFPNFDIVWNLPPDYMHQTLLGVTKQLFNAWKKILSGKDFEKIKKRMANIKLSRDLQRNLRSLNYVKKYKALEWKIWLLFVSAPCLHGILPDEMFHSYLRLVNCVYTYLQKSITNDEIDNCEREMLQFVGECEIIFNTEIMTFNLHGHLHYADSIRRVGPLWANSAFPFETAIGKFLKEINAPNGSIKEIAQKWLARCTFESYIESNEGAYEKSLDYCRSLFNSKILLENCTRLDNVIMVGVSTRNNIVEKMMEQFLQRKVNITVYHRCIYNSSRFYTVKYTRVKKTNDSVIETMCDKTVQMHYFVKVDNTCYICGYQWLVGKNDFNGTDEPTVKHILKVTEKKSHYIIFKIDNIKRKAFVIDNTINEYISFLPNNYECH